MQLTKFLRGYYKRYRHFPGTLYRGKVKIVHKPTENIKAKAVHDLLQQQRNIQILEAPYLTPEQEHGHVVDLGERKRRNDEFLWNRFTAKIPKHKTLEEHLAHLNHTKPWE